MMDALAGFVEVCKIKFYGTDVERAIDEEVCIMKAEVKLAELSVDLEKESSKIKDNTIKQQYSAAVARIRNKVK